MSNPAINIKRIYESISEEDGKRILVDRLWPRGISKEQAKLDCWMKEVAPSTELRKRFNHRPEEFVAFKMKYIEELATEPEKRKKIEELLHMMQNETITLLYAAKDRENNQAVVIKEVLIKEWRDANKRLHQEG